MEPTWPRRPFAALCVTGALVLSAAAGCGVGGREEAPQPTADGSGNDPGPDPADGADSGADEVRATVETEPVPHEGDAADDPAVWVHPRDPARSAVIATDKQGGLLVYDLSGRQVQYLAVGEVNNVDVGVAPGGGAPLVVTGNREDDSIGVYEVDPRTRRLSEVPANGLEPDVDIYGSCLYSSEVTGRLYVFITSKSGEVEQWELFREASGRVAGDRVRSFVLGSQIEGCVADEESGVLYVGEEDVGIWRYGAEPDASGEGTLVASVSETGPLVADVEGLTFVPGQEGRGYLVASSQGSDSFVVYTGEAGNRFVRSFRVIEGDGIDGVSDTDGLTASAAPLGPDFPFGVLVVQDGSNDDGNQNFKLVPLERVLPR